MIRIFFLVACLVTGCAFASPIDRSDEQVSFEECESSCRDAGAKHMTFERSLGRVQCVCLAACEDAGAP